jgi:hemoglobin/transferrin/lactoferrin receptor protein
MYNDFGIPPRGGSIEAQTLVNRYFDLDTYGFQTQLTTVKTPRWFFVAGLDALRDQTDGDTEQFRTYYDANGDPVPSASGVVTRRTTSASVPDGCFDNYGGYLQSEWYLHPQWTLSAGGRYTQYRYRTDYGLNQPALGPPPAQPTYFDPVKVDDGAGSGSVGLVYAPVKDLHLSVNAANGYRQPNAQDLFFSGFASVGYVEGNATLEAEKSMSYDLGVKWGPGALAIAGNLFYSSYDDLIDAVAVPTPSFLPPGTPTYQYTNISKARIWGGEAEAEWRFLPQWTARSTAAGAVGDITSAEAIEALYGVTADEAPLPNVPPFKGSASVRWTSAQGRYWIEPATRFSWRTNRLPLPTPGVEQFTQFKPEWIIGDLFMGARLPGGQRLLLGVRNFTDTPYQQALGSLEEPGINLVGSLSADF